MKRVLVFGTFDLIHPGHINFLYRANRIVIADHRSTDGTAAIARQFCARHSAAGYHRIRHPAQSHDLIKGFAGEKVWMFGVDGDEIYEPDRLAVLRGHLLSGKYDGYWMLL